MAQYLIRSDPFARVDLEHAFQQVHGFRVYLLILLAVEIEPHLTVILVDLFELASLEECFFGEEDMEDDASREDIADWVYLLSLDESGDFGGDIAGCATPVEDIVICIHEGGKSEVHDHWV